MIHDKELLNHLHQNADMGRSSIHTIMNLTNDAEFTKALSGQLEEYQKLYDQTGQLLKEKGAEPEDATAISKTMAYVSSNLKTITDHSPSKLSEMMIQGSNMGITELTKQLNNYECNDRNILALAQKQIKTEESNLEDMKKFL